MNAKHMQDFFEKHGADVKSEKIEEMGLGGHALMTHGPDLLQNLDLTPAQQDNILKGVEDLRKKIQKDPVDVFEWLVAHLLLITGLSHYSILLGQH